MGHKYLAHGCLSSLLVVSTPSLESLLSHSVLLFPPLQLLLLAWVWFTSLPVRSTSLDIRKLLKKGKKNPVLEYLCHSSRTKSVLASHRSEWLTVQRVVIKVMTAAPSLPGHTQLCMSWENASVKLRTTKGGRLKSLQKFGIVSRKLPRK